MSKFRKKPVVIEAIQWTGSNVDQIGRFIQDFSGITAFVKGNEIKIPTLEGEMTASKGDWIIKGVSGEFYPCKPDIFEKTYETVDEGQEKGKAVFKMIENAKWKTTDIPATALESMFNVLLEEKYDWLLERKVFIDRIQQLQNEQHDISLINDSLQK